METRTFEVLAITDLMSAKFKCQVLKTDDFWGDYAKVWDHVLELTIQDQIKGTNLCYCDIKEIKSD